MLLFSVFVCAYTAWIDFMWNLIADDVNVGSVVARRHVDWRELCGGSVRKTVLPILSLPSPLRCTCQSSCP